MQHLDSIKQYASTIGPWVCFWLLLLKRFVADIVSTDQLSLIFFSPYFQILIDRMFHFHRVQTKMRTIYIQCSSRLSVPFQWELVFWGCARFFFYEGVHFLTFTKSEWTNSGKHWISTQFAIHRSCHLMQQSSPPKMELPGFFY